MPTRAPKRCTTPGCGNDQTPHIQSGKCPPHLAEHHQDTNARRPSPHAQGYDRRWQKTSRTYRQDHPVCECTAPRCHGPAPCGRQSAHVDHIDGRKPSDPGGHDPQLLQALCVSCHSTKTARHDGGFGRT